MKKNKGFTLIELLVVIAIIGILASVVLTSLSRVKDNAKDSKIKSLLIDSKNIAMIYFATEGKYDGICDTTVTANGATPIGSVVLKAAQAGGFLYDPNDQPGDGIKKATCNEEIESWAVQVPLMGSRTGGVKTWCVDSRGASKFRNSKIGETTNC